MIKTVNHLFSLEPATQSITFEVMVCCRTAAYSNEMGIGSNVNGIQLGHNRRLQYSNGEQLEWHCAVQLLVIESINCRAISRGKYAKSRVPNMDRVHQLIFRRVQSVGARREIFEKGKVSETR